MAELVRINRYIASSSQFSRREVDVMIEEGRINLNGDIVVSQGVKIDPDNDAILIDNEPLMVEEIQIYKFYKPRKVLTEYGFGRGRATLDSFDILKSKKLPYSGRLDYESEGLILFTNDGYLIQRIQKSESKVEKRYYVTVDRLLNDYEVTELRNGLETDSEKYLPCRIKEVGRKNYEVILIEGKKRQIREMFGYFGSSVKQLVRFQIANILLDDMSPGEIRKLNKFELKELKKIVGL